MPTVVENQIAAVYGLCGVAATDAVLYTSGDARVLELMNEVYADLGRRIPLWRRVAEVVMVDDQARYAMPAGMRDILPEYGAVRYGAQKLPVEYLPRLDLANADPDYRTATKVSVPTHWYRDDWQNFALYPPPQVYQQETATAAGTITGSGDMTITITYTGGSSAAAIPVVAGDTPQVWAERVRGYTALIVAMDTLGYTLGGSGASITLTSQTAGSVDAALNIALDNGTCTGIVTASTSADTTPTLSVEGYLVPVASNATGAVLPLGKASVANTTSATPSLPPDCYDLLKYGTAKLATEEYLADDERAQALYKSNVRQYDRLFSLLLDRTVI